MRPALLVVAASALLVGAAPAAPSRTPAPARPAQTRPPAPAPQADLPPVEVQAGRVEVRSLGLTSADIVLHLVVANHTETPLTLRELAYEAHVDGQPFKSGRVAGPLTLLAGRAVSLAVPATVGYGEAGGKVLAILSRGEVPYRVVGSVRVDGPKGTRLERFDERGTVGVSGAKAD